MTELMPIVKKALIHPATEEREDEWVGIFRFPPEFPGFSGHFPGYPILPAVIQLMMVQAVIEEVQGERCRLVCLERAKFQERILPEKVIQVRCRLKDKERGLVEAILEVEGKKAATLRLLAVLKDERLKA